MFPVKAPFERSYPSYAANPFATSPNSPTTPSARTVANELFPTVNHPPIRLDEGNPMKFNVPPFNVVVALPPVNVMVFCVIDEIVTAPVTGIPVP
jgi:hypothetical protein